MHPRTNFSMTPPTPGKIFEAGEEVEVEAEVVSINVRTPTNSVQMPGEGVLILQSDPILSHQVTGRKSPKNVFLFIGVRGR